ncbi:MAG: hypothetical protein UW87_C0043G0003 [Candidatus Moranbacteria bacterium GW2011_GWC2_45_10]|nr:MAG: hypothetical protein UW87_C0043G0003 [Candidatus Moranbacteria bacterium GW2011_GWC2_45_10]
MCLAYPGKIEKIEGDQAVADFDGMKKTVNIKIIKVVNSMTDCPYLFFRRILRRSWKHMKRAENLKNKKSDKPDSALINWKKIWINKGIFLERSSFGFLLPDESARKNIRKNT